MSASPKSFEDCPKMEEAIGSIEREKTRGGHIADLDQPSLPVVHRRFANPAPLGLLSFATGIFLVSCFGVKARGVATPNVLVGVLLFFGGVCQYISGIMEFVAGNTFGATLFPSFASLNVSYAMIYLPGTGILAAYTDKATGELNAEFPQALAIYIWAWFTLAMIFTIGAVRSSWVLMADLLAVDLYLALAACGYMTGNESLIKGSSGMGFVVAFLSYWAGAAGLYAGGVTPWTVPTFPMYHEK